MNYSQLLNKNLFKEALEQAEKEIYTKAYIYSGCNQSATAKLIGVARGTVIYKLKNWGIDKKTAKGQYIAKI